MKAEVQISRVHKGSPYNLQAILFDIKGKDEEDILSNSQVLTEIGKVFGNKLKVSITPMTDEGLLKPYWWDYYLTKKQGDYHVTQKVNNIPKQNNETMSQLIKITEQNGKRAVSARELHQFLGITERFSKWFERQLQYGFVENQDYAGCEVFNTLANQTLQDYALTTSAAKEIAMIQRTPKGREARQYFIEMERVALAKVQEVPQFKKPDVNSITEKRAELINIIRDNLRWGDMHKAARKLNINASYVKRVMINKEFNTEQADTVVNELYNVAMQNKNELLFSYQEMIDMLRN